ncbi:MAG TPA: bifunctional [glutamate--ammonia ligase]-adenylyl-L-tyrosine phosphorylase/[glutamate--ammonia-ligase] adenylyltransferase [Kofleriaceae bacterium]|nr:bifunctional [glutamate--ammonia ligase]-adenylyl-L-tyrosine phosphorylase/[glutamate--ammonia-ligase] adenylyltransferase [Kofleriaceae bacterium]
MSGPVSMADAVRDAITGGAPDPDDALRRAEQVAAAGVELRDLPADALAILVLSCQRAPYLARLLARDPGRLARVAGDPHLRREKPRAVLAAELAGRIPAGDDEAAVHAALRRLRADEMVRLGARELGLGDPREVGRELAHLAEVCLDAALAFHDRRLRARHGPPRWHGEDGVERDCALTIIGMGKLGGEELNFASDIDLIYVYSSDAGAAGALSLNEYYARLCERITAALSDVTDEDTVFRVDLRLRPEGSRGTIANSLPSAERYYETWGRPWERQAWLKARPCAGDAALGAEVMATMAPFIHPRSTSPKVIAEVAELNRRIKAELDSAGVESGFDLKNGVGGIREVEFFVQALQLIHAGHRQSLRARSTLVALDQLLFAGLITEAEHRALASAYVWLRRAEHLLQLDSGRQTQRLPVDAEELERFARRLGLDGAAALRAALARHTGEVARLFATVGEEEGPPPEVVALAGGALPPERERELLAALGFRDAEAAQRELEAARRRPLSPFHRAASGAAARIAPRLLAELAESPDPDQALRTLVELATRASAPALWVLFFANPGLMRQIASLFGTSEFLSRQFVARPELVDSLVPSARTPPRQAPAQLAAQADARLAEVDADDLERRWSVLAEWKNAQVLRIGLADVAGELDVDEVAQQLSAVADVVLQRAYRLVEEPLLARHGRPREDGGAPARLAVLALGSFGARELNYASDLDLVFVYSADGGDDLPVVTFMTRLAQRLMTGLHAPHPGGRLYEVDARLRPSGTQGLLVSSLAGWEKYHQGDARLWERQALIKLRPVAGDPELGAQVAALAADYVWGAPPREDPAPLIIAMRDKMERELGSGGELDLKVGRGGLVDAEFAAQFLQLVHGHRLPALRVGSTTAALAAAGAAEVADPADCQLLASGHRFLRRVENRMRIVHDRSVHRLPPAGPDLDLLARRCGYPDGAALLRACTQWMRDVRGAWDRIVRPRS